MWVSLNVFRKGIRKDKSNETNNFTSFQNTPPWVYYTFPFDQTSSQSVYATKKKISPTQVYDILQLQFE